MTNHREIAPRLPIPEWVKRLLLAAQKPFERRGVCIAARRKILPPHICQAITDVAHRSFCPFAHFDIAWRAIKHIEERNIDGDIVLFGVASGGLAKFIAEESKEPRRLWFYDTFDGGSLPGPQDGPFERANGQAIKHTMSQNADDVMSWVNGRFNKKRINWIVGDILKTVPANLPDKIALLYMDTDWYETTIHELRHCEPRVTQGGIIIQDDMGLCVGARNAVLEYYSEPGRKTPFIQPMDEAGSAWVKE